MGPAGVGSCWLEVRCGGAGRGPGAVGGETASGERTGEKGATLVFWKESECHYYLRTKGKGGGENVTPTYNK